MYRHCKIITKSHFEIFYRSHYYLSAQTGRNEHAFPMSADIQYEQNINKKY